MIVHVRSWSHHKAAQSGLDAAFYINSEECAYISPEQRVGRAGIDQSLEPWRLTRVSVTELDGKDRQPPRRFTWKRGMRLRNRDGLIVESHPRAAREREASSLLGLSKRLGRVRLCAQPPRRLQRTFLPRRRFWFRRWTARSSGQAVHSGVQKGVLRPVSTLAHVRLNQIAREPFYS